MKTLKNKIIVDKKELNSLIENRNLIGGDNFEIEYKKVNYAAQDTHGLMALLDETPESYEVELELGFTGWIQVGKAMEKAKK